jgi:glycosyltransferase involved in cell wall biosynthesis
VRLSDAVGDLFAKVQCVVDLTPQQWDVTAYLQIPPHIKYAHVANAAEAEEMRTAAGKGAACFVVALGAKDDCHPGDTILKGMRIGDFCLVISDVWSPGNLLTTVRFFAENGLIVESIHKVKHRVFETVVLSAKIADDDGSGLLRLKNEAQLCAVWSQGHATESDEELRAERAEMAGEIARLRRELARERRKLRAVKASLSFQLGNMVVQALLRPGRNTIMLPYRALKLVAGAARARTFHTRPIVGAVPKTTYKGGLLVSGHSLGFIDLLCRKLSDYGYDVAVDGWTGHSKHDVRRSRELIDEANTIICEWCLGNAVWYSRNKRPGQKLIIRFHLQERDLNWPAEVNMRNVDSMIFVGPHIRREAIVRFGWETWADEKLSVIPNYVDTEAFDLPKEPEAQFNIGIVGVVFRRKRLDLALDVIEKLRRQDKRFHLYIKGKVPRELPWMLSRVEELQYFDDQMGRIKSTALLKDAVHFDGWGKDMPEWYRKIGFILSVSDFESFHLAIAEGAASRAIPVSLEWEGVKEIYPHDWSYHTTDEIVNAILQIARSGRLGEIAEARRAYVKENFDIGRVARLWLEIIEAKGDRTPNTL